MANDLSDPKSVRRAQKQADRVEAAAAQFLRTAMATVEGRAYFLRWLELCHIFHNPFSDTAEQTAFKCGEMNIGQMLLIDMMAWCPDQYILMMREREDGRRTSTSDDRRSRASQNNGWDASDTGDTDDSGDPDALPGSGDGSDEATDPYR